MVATLPAYNTLFVAHRVRPNPSGFTNSGNDSQNAASLERLWRQTKALSKKEAKGERIRGWMKVEGVHILAIGWRMSERLQPELKKLITFWNDDGSEAPLRLSNG
jgi:hypothetical protein